MLLSKKDMYNYGYSYIHMIPVSECEATHLFNINREVFMLFPDDTELVVEDISDIIRHAECGGMFGVEE